jgi:hypothetical protein
LQGYQVLLGNKWEISCTDITVLQDDIAAEKTSGKVVLIK